MSEITYKFEKDFAKFIGSKHAVMVNSGSSANLLASFALINPKKKDIWQMGLDCVTINPNLDDCYQKIYNLIQAEIKDDSKDYDKDYIRNHIEKLTS